MTDDKKCRVFRWRKIQVEAPECNDESCAIARFCSNGFDRICNERSDAALDNITSVVPNSRAP